MDLHLTILVKSKILLEKQKFTEKCKIHRNLYIICTALKQLNPGLDRLVLKLMCLFCLLPVNFDSFRHPPPHRFPRVVCDL